MHSLPFRDVSDFLAKIGRRREDKITYMQVEALLKEN